MLRSASGACVEDIKNDSQKEDGALEHLRNLVENLDTTPSENYLQRFLYGANFNVDEAFKKLKIIHDHMLECPEWYTKDGPLKFKNFIDKDIRVVLPDCDKEGRPIYLLKNGNIEPSTTCMLDVVAVDDIWIEYILNKHPEAAAKGLCVIMDIKDQSWKLSRWIQPHNIRNSLKKVDNLPFKEYKVHVVNNSWWISIAIKLIWPFMPQRIKDMITFHFDDMNSFYEYIDKKVLPIEYGGLKEIKYAEIYDDLYKSNDEIFKSFSCYRNVKK